MHVFICYFAVDTSCKRCCVDETTGECAVHTDFFTNTFVNHNDGRPCVQGVCLSVSKQVFWQKVDWKATVKFCSLSVWVKVFSTDTELSIGKIFPQCIGIGKPWLSILKKWLFSIEVFWNFHPCICRQDFPLCVLSH